MPDVRKLDAEKFANIISQCGLQTSYSPSPISQDKEVTIFVKFISAFTCHFCLIFLQPRTKIVVLNKNVGPEKYRNLSVVDPCTYDAIEVSFVDSIVV